VGNEASGRVQRSLEATLQARPRTGAKGRLWLIVQHGAASCVGSRL
jgi:hypothetical protein